MRPPLWVVGGAAAALVATPAAGATGEVDLEHLEPKGSLDALADDALEYPRRYDFVVDFGEALEHPRRGDFVVGVEPGRPVALARPAVERVTEVVGPRAAGPALVAVGSGLHSCAVDRGRAR